ncbi:hypothetical protein NFI96_023286 [Prochilodus magdalenae]|nr:hypothetical protein NFI96_023286 [Prochilodus magdalenae]
MFYYPNVLQRHSGCFSTIWLAATKGIRITRREFLKVNVGKTCDDIIDYLKVQVPPLHPSLPRPRFSLYLSSQLQYGVVIVFHQQCAFLLEEVQQTIERFLRSEKHSQIDMQKPDRLALNLPDSLFLLEEAEGALAPFFGKMDAECELPSPYQLPQPWQPMMASSPERHLETRKENTAPIGLNVSPETITIKDKEPVTILTAEFGGAELQEATAHEIDMLMQQHDQFVLGAEVEDKEMDRAAEGEKTKELEAAMVSLEQLNYVTSEDKSWLFGDTEQPLDGAMHMVAMDMTPPLTAIPATTEASERDLELEKEAEQFSSEIPVIEERVPPEIRNCKRQLMFADRHTQISQDAMRGQINNPLTETRLLSDVLTPIPSTSKISSSYLFSSPCNMLLHFDLQSLWKQCCVPVILPDPTSRYHPEEDGELSELERERVGEKEVEWRRESSREVLRESAEAALRFSEISAASDVVLDVSKGDGSQSDLITPTNRWSPVDEAAVHMDAILEEHVELPQGEMDTSVITTHSLLKMLNTYIDRFGKVSFHSLLPPEADRSIAAHLFYKVLVELVCVQKLSVNQSGQYGPITISGGRM